MASSSATTQVKLRASLRPIFMFFMVSPGGSGGEALAHGRTRDGHHAHDVNDDEHALVDRCQAEHIAGVGAAVEHRGRLDLFGREARDVGDAVDHHAHDATADTQDDDDGARVVAGYGQAQFHAHVDNGHDDAAQVDHALE